MKDIVTFSHAAIRILIWLVGHATHHVGSIHAGLIPWVRSHGVPLLESRVASVGKGILKTYRVTPDPTKEGQF